MLSGRALVWTGTASLAFAFWGCVPADEGGGGGTGSFSRGFAFIRDRDVYVANDPDYRQPLPLTNTGDNRHPSLSKDARRVVFVHAGSELDVITASAGASPTRVFSAGSGRSNFRTPVFSADGNSIVFAYDRNSVSYLGRVNLDGTGFLELTTGAKFYGGPSFYYPDVANVFAIEGTLPSQYNKLVKINLNSGSVSSVADSLGPEACSVVNRVAISPDGRKAAFDARRFSGGACTGAVRIFVMDLGSGRVNRLTDYPGDPGANDGFPTWMGSDQVGFSSNVNRADNVYVLPASSDPTSGGFKVPSASEPSYGPN